MQQNATKVKMSRKTSIVAHRAWELIRALMCARNGEMCRNRVALTVNVFHKLVRKLIYSSANNESRTALLYGDHEFSFQNSPSVHVRMHRPAAALRFKLPHIPCIRPQAAGDDDEDDVMWRERVNRTCYLKEAGEEGEEDEDEDEDEMSEEGIDERAEEFIAKFYEEMKMQRQISYV